MRKFVKPENSGKIKAIKLLIGMLVALPLIFLITIILQAMGNHSLSVTIVSYTSLVLLALCMTAGRIIILKTGGAGLFWLRQK